uniref:Uncharacterized protein n=1 Tax=Cacopsylla melanoneura TaxID=428564 RepID=A0A8D9ELC8_9HEMI
MLDPPTQLYRSRETGETLRIVIVTPCQPVVSHTTETNQIDTQFYFIQCTFKTDCQRVQVKCPSFGETEVNGIIIYQLVRRNVVRARPPGVTSSVSDVTTRSLPLWLTYTRNIAGS